MAYRMGTPPRAKTIVLAAAFIALLYGWLEGGPYTETFPRFFDERSWKLADGGENRRCGMLLDLQIPYRRSRQAT